MKNSINVSHRIEFFLMEKVKDKIQLNLTDEFDYQQYNEIENALFAGTRASWQENSQIDIYAICHSIQATIENVSFLRTFKWFHEPMLLVDQSQFIFKDFSLVPTPSLPRAVF